MNIGVVVQEELPLSNPRQSWWMDSSLILNPRDSTSLHDMMMVSNRMSILGLSQDFWLLVGVGTGISCGKSCFNTFRAEFLSSYWDVERWAGSRSSISKWAPPAEAKKISGSKMEDAHDLRHDGWQQMVPRNQQGCLKSCWCTQDT